jgi:hypothetical protein
VTHAAASACHRGRAAGVRTHSHTHTHPRNHEHRPVHSRTLTHARLAREAKPGLWPSSAGPAGALFVEVQELADGGGPFRSGIESASSTLNPRTRPHARTRVTSSVLVIPAAPPSFPCVCRRADCGLVAAELASLAKAALFCTQMEP